MNEQDLPVHLPTLVHAEGSVLNCLLFIPLHIINQRLAAVAERHKLQCDPIIMFMVTASTGAVCRNIQYTCG